MTTPCEFIVSGFIEGFAGKMRLIGRCGDASIRVGDVFDMLKDKFDGPRRIRLEVMGIQAYERNLPELGSGMTGALEVRGDDVLRIRAGCVLVGAASNQRVLTGSDVAKPAVEHV